jgi:2,4-dienoyl-CoA reductase-like NADH-dependent reductase (Old Yellow Enzyme family)
MSKLFTPVSLGGLSLPNRVVVSPMCMYSADAQGSATDWHMIHLGHLALSGAGLLYTEATAVEAAGRITPTDLGLYSDANERALGRVVEAIRRYSPIKLAMQLAHAGRKASSRAPWDGGQYLPPEQGGWVCDAPSALPHGSDEPAPRALDRAGLDRIRDAFAAAARRADRLGYDVIEIHCAHGYLLHEFLSPLANQRGDEYGGSLENRMRFPLEVFCAVREAVSADKPVGVRVSATDWVEGGWDIEQTLALVRQLERRGCAFVDVSSGGVSPLQKIPMGPGYQVPLAQQVKQATGMTTMTVGMITEAEQAEAIVADDKADLVALARGMLYDPRWAWHAAAQLGAQVHAPQQYWRAAPHGIKDLFLDAHFGQR